MKVPANITPMTPIQPTSLSTAHQVRQEAAATVVNQFRPRIFNFPPRFQTPVPGHFVTSYAKCEWRRDETACIGFFLEVFDRHEEDSPGMNRGNML